MIRTLGLVIVVIGTLTAFGEPLQNANQDDPPDQTTFLNRPPPKSTGVDSDLRKLQIEQFKTAQQVLILQLKAFDRAKLLGGFDPTMPLALKIVQYYLELAPTKEERLAMLADYVKLTKEFEADLQKKFDIGDILLQEIMSAKYTRLDAEIMLLKAKEESKP